MTKQNSSFIEKNNAQEAATDILRDKTEFVKNSVFDVFAYTQSLSDIELKIEPLHDSVSGYIEKKKR